MMIQNTTFLRRAVGSLLVALVTLVGFQAHAQFDFQATTSVDWDEAHALDGATGGQSLIDLNARIDDAVSQDSAVSCYTLSGAAAAAFAFSATADCRSDGKTTGTMNGVNGTDDAPAIVMKTTAGVQAHLDFEKGKTQVLEVNGFRGAAGATRKKSTLTVNITITDHDERPVKTQAEVPTWYWSPDQSGTVLVSSLFRDPEGSPVFFDPMGARNADVFICDSANAGVLDLGSTPTDPGRPTATDFGPGTDVTFGGTAATGEACSVSNPARTTAPAGGFKGGDGNRVLSTEITGPVLTIKADSLVTAPDATTTPTDRLRGTYAATVWIRAWSHSVAANPALSPASFARINIQVKVGANNVPQFAGGAIGYTAEMTEGATSTSGAKTAWIAGDLDAASGTVTNYNDDLKYTLAGAVKGAVTIHPGGTVSLVHTEADPAASPDPILESLTLTGKGLDFEQVQSFTVMIEVTDNWSPKVTVPVTVTLKGVNELERALKADGKTPNVIGDQKMVKDRKRTFDLNEYFRDPEGDNITYSAYTNIGTGIVSVDPETNVLTITGPAAGEYTATLTATDDGKTNGEDDPKTIPTTFKITSIDENAAPVIAHVKAGVKAIGASINEKGSKGKALDLSIDFTDDNTEAPTPVLTGSDLFEAVIGEKTPTKVTVKVKDDAELNYEAAPRHVLKLHLVDGWDDEVMSESLEIQVSVVDDNDAPMVKEDAEIADQGIVVNGSASLYTGDHFTDEDGDRLLVDAASSDMTKVMVSVSGLDKVTFSGVAETEEDMPVTVTLTASDPDGESATLTFKVTVGANNPPVADSDAFAAALPENNTINVGSTADIDLDGLFSDPDGGDMVTSITASTSDEDVLLVVSTNDGDSITLVGRASGMATLTITAMDGGGNSTSEMAEITVNEAPAESMPIEPIEMDRTTPHVVDISGVFTDGDDGADMLTITAEAVGEGMERIELEVMNGELTITGVLGVMPGDAEILLTATDPHGATATSTIMVTVVNVGPTVAMSLEDITDLDRTMPATLDVSGVFMDADGTMLTVTAEVKDSMIVELSEIDENGMLTVTALAVGMTSVVLTAVDEDGASIMADFEVTVINIAPVVAEAIADQSTTRAEDLSLNVSGVFDDPDADNDMLTITVTVANEMYVSAMLTDDMLAISGLDVGTSAITLTATDADGGMVETMFDVTIDNVAPVVANSISPITLEVGGQAASQSISGLFMDDDDMLTYTVTSSNAGIASTSLTGMTAMVAPMSRGSTTITVTATDPHGASASVTGSVSVGDGELKAVAAKSLAGFGRAMLASVSSSVGSRLMNDARSSDLTLDAWAPVDNQGTMSAMTAEDRSEVAWNTVTATNTATTAGPSSAMQAGSMSGIDALRSTFGQSFALNLGSTDNRSNWSVWGDIDRQSYEGAGYDGMATSIYLGADVTVAECWMFGVAVSTNSGESDYTYGTATQTMDMSLTTVLPYVSYQPTHGSSIWGVAGFGSGELETTVVGAGNETSDLTTQLTLVGGSQELTRLGRMSLALRGDAAVASVETEDGSGAADGLAADVNRIRIGLEGSLRSDTGNGGIVEPFGQVSLRSDGGDGDTGTGVEVAGGVRLTSSTFTLEAQGRTLAMHGADEYSESGFSLMAKLNPSASATGVSVTIAPRWGADALGNGMLWQDTLNLNSAQTYGALAGFGNSGANKSIDTQIGYGMLVANEQYLLTPFVDLGVSDSDRREMLLGITLQQMVEGTTSLDVNLALGRVEEHTGASSGKIGLNATLRF